MKKVIARLDCKGCGVVIEIETEIIPELLPVVGEYTLVSSIVNQTAWPLHRCSETQVGALLFMSMTWHDVEVGK